MYVLSSPSADKQGGRQLDQARTGFDSLRSIHEQDPTLSKQLEIYIDGGVRRGTDVLQALAFGAKGVGLGRTFLWGQAAYGEKGVLRAIRSMSIFPRLYSSSHRRIQSPNPLTCHI